MNIQSTIDKVPTTNGLTLPPDGAAAATAAGRGAANLKDRAGVVAAVAARHADAVDREARFPREAIATLRSERLLGIMVPPDLGGEEASISDVVDVCYMLGRGCAST